MYVLNQNQKNFITSSKIKKLMAVLDISAEDLCKNTGIDFHDFSEALNGNKKFNINQREAVFHSVKNAVDDNFKFADKPQIHEDITALLRNYLLNSIQVQNGLNRQKFDR